MERGYCKDCHKRTTHKNRKGEWLCIGCEWELLKKLGLEEEVTKVDDEKVLKLVEKAGLSPKELQLLLNQPHKTNVSNRTYNHSTTGHIRIGIISDTHIGHEKFDEELLAHAGRVFKKQGIKRVYHAGDLLEGMSGRPGHIYELAQIGFAQQIKEAERLFKRYLPAKDFEVFGITGNHDHWYMKGNNGGISVGDEFQHRVPNYTFLGEDEADIKLSRGVIMKLFHPEDGTAYATSYKLQKLMESLEGGRKPNILVEGHYHKALYMFNRNIHGVEAGTLMGQSGWMRGKKIPAHKGFWIFDVDTGKRGIEKFTPSFYPAYD